MDDRQFRTAMGKFATGETVRILNKIKERKIFIIGGYCIENLIRHS
ncbi:hypothetical protein [Neobacillus drentensis]|nr:hypothetical protein [Neobacillus drentensis]